jgi:hypothetical protein
MRSNERAWKNCISALIVIVGGATERWLEGTPFPNTNQRRRFGVADVSFLALLIGWLYLIDLVKPAA